MIEENKKKQNNIFTVNEQWRPQITNCPYCLFSYKVYGKYETIVEDTAYILMKSNQEKLLKIGVTNSDTKHHQASNRRKEFWSAVNPEFDSLVIWPLRSYSVTNWICFLLVL